MVENIPWKGENFMEAKKILLSDGTPMAYDELGNGKPVMFIAGNCDTRNGALAVYKDIFANAGFHVICPDHRGCGDSRPSRTHPVTLDLLGKDYCEFIQQMDLRELTLIGHSMGGDIICEIVREMGCERLRAAILMDSTVKCYANEGEDWPYSNSGGTFTREQADAANAMAANDFIGSMRFLAQACTPDGTPEEIENSLNMLLSTIEVESMAEVYPTVFNMDLRDTLKYFNLPTAYVYADAPEAVVHYQITDYYKSQIPGPYMSFGYKTNDHGFVTTLAARVGKDLLEFLRQHP